MDMYFKNSSEQLKIESLHLIGSTCMMIATKCEEVFPISLDVFVKQICHNKFTAQQLLDKEIEILDVLQFKTNAPNCYDLLACSLCLLNIQESKIKNYLREMCLKMINVCLLSCDLLSNMNYNQLVSSVLVIGLKAIE